MCPCRPEGTFLFTKKTWICALPIDFGGPRKTRIFMDRQQPTPEPAYRLTVQFSNMLENFLGFQNQELKHTTLQYFHLKRLPVSLHMPLTKVGGFSEIRNNFTHIFSHRTTQEAVKEKPCESQGDFQTTQTAASKTMNKICTIKKPA